MSKHVLTVEKMRTKGSCKLKNIFDTDVNSISSVVVELRALYNIIPLNPNFQAKTFLYCTNFPFGSKVPEGIVAR